jgi:hypothetical protein
MSNSNYRLVRKSTPSGENTFNIHEVFYSKHGNPEYCSGQQLKNSTDDINEIRTLLIKLLKALDKPVLKYEDF